MDQTEILDPLVTLRLGSQVFSIERDLVTVAAFLRFLDATGRTAPVGFDPLGDPRAPALGVSHVMAEQYAAHEGMRLPTDDEWTAASVGAGASVGLSDQGVRGLCRVWEWTSTPMKTGHVVRGGRYRDRPELPPAPSHRSWENEGAPDIGFRCVVDGERTASR